MKKLKIGVIGVGNWGINDVRNISQENNIFDFIGIFDSDCEQSQKVAKQYDLHIFASSEELLDNVEAVIIATPSVFHKEYAVKAADRGVHSLIEKPLAVTSEDAGEISDLFREKGLKLQVGHVERFNPVIMELSKLLDSNEVFYIDAHRYSPVNRSGLITDVSVVEDLMIHDVELVCFLMEPYKVTKIHATGEKLYSDKTDFATCMLEFESNSHAVINASRVSQGKERKINIHTRDKVINADLLTRTLTVTKSTNIEVEEHNAFLYKQAGIVQQIFIPDAEPLRTELISFYKAVVYNEPILVDGEDAAKAVGICEEVSKIISLRSFY